MNITQNMPEKHRIYQKLVSVFSLHDVKIQQSE